MTYIFFTSMSEIKAISHFHVLCCMTAPWKCMETNSIDVRKKNPGYLRPFFLAVHTNLFFNL